MKIKSVNPYTEEVNWTYDSFSFGECESKIENSRAAFSGWSSLSAEERTKYFSRAGEVLRRNTEIYAEIITKEMGKPIRQSRSEIEKCAWLCDYYAENAAEFLKDELVDTGAEKSYVTFEPLGVIFGIMPWNFPFLAGLQVCSTCNVCRKCLCAQARLKCAQVGAGGRKSLS